MPNALFTKKEVAEELGITVRTLEKFQARRAIDVTRLGRLVRFSRAAIDKFLVASTTPAID